MTHFPGRPRCRFFFLAVALLASGRMAPVTAQMVGIPGNWDWLDPLEWGKHVLPGVESKWERGDREYEERKAAEAARQKALAEMFAAAAMSGPRT
jgi:hypothetical protein